MQISSADTVLNLPEGTCVKTLTDRSDDLTAPQSPESDSIHGRFRAQDETCIAPPGAQVGLICTTLWRVSHRIAE